MAVDILKLPLTTHGNRYVAVFAGYLTKWPDAYAIPDQKAETIAKLLVENIICRHGIPEELLLDRSQFSVQFDSGNISVARSEENKHIWLPSSDRWLGRKVQFHTY